jgi:hypothetical protein
MIRTNHLGWMASSIAVVCFGGLLIGCGGISPGDYDMYRVALSVTKLSSGCAGADPNTQSDRDDGVTDDDWVITANPNSEYFLTTAKYSLQGEKADSGFSFHETKNDVTYDTDDLSTTTTRTITTNAISIPITVDGASISGTITDRTTEACDGACNVAGSPSCSMTTTFAGTRIDNVTLYATPK